MEPSAPSKVNCADGYGDVGVRRLIPAKFVVPETVKPKMKISLKAAKTVTETGKIDHG